MKSIGKILLVLVGLVGLLAACSKNEAPEQPTLENDSNEVDEVVGKPVEKELFEAPFTGLMSEEESDRRPVLVTISNDPNARPQSGLSEADLIYELIVEGNTTRYLALFQSTLPEEMGPIRSSREMFIHLAKGLDAFYVAHGYSPDALALLQAGYVDHVNGMQHDGTLFKRSQDRYAPHNSYISNENIDRAIEQVNAPTEMKKLPALSFHESFEDVKIEEQARSITVQNGSHPQFTSTYTYDAASGSYTKSVNDIESIDKANDEQVELANILVLEAAHQTIDAEGRQAIDLESGGQALLFQAGQVEEVEWENRDGLIVPIKNGVPAKLVPGTTWTHILRTNPGIEEKVSYSAE